MMSSYAREPELADATEQVLKLGGGVAHMLKEVKVFGELLEEVELVSLYLPLRTSSAL